MDNATLRRDVAVAGAAAGVTVALSLLYAYGLGIDVGFVGTATPLGVYFLYTFTHNRLPEQLDTAVTWIGLTVVVAAVTILAVTTPSTGL
ncbi:hypothetical protein [Halonotius sp. GCM10025705]|uniref:hypothetical protein n=1 Tax=Halonotius sp. GCM10025705 TaxID=3252678 RepID=UPI00360632B0